MNADLCCPIPLWPRYVGLLGTLPFFVLALASWPTTPWRLTSQEALLLYAALMLTFITGMHLAMVRYLGTRGRRPASLGLPWSFLPAALGWVALLLPPAMAVGVMLTGFWLHFMVDRSLSAHVVLPEWYLPMRFSLTTAASLALLVGGAAMLFGGLALPVAMGLWSVFRG
jgi:hypothetical protein